MTEEPKVMPQLFRKRPVVIEAIQFDGSYASVLRIVSAFGALGFESTGVMGTPGACTLTIQTFEGTMTANAGDWVIRGIKGELYPCKPDIFEASYEKVESLFDIFEASYEKVESPSPRVSDLVYLASQVKMREPLPRVTEDIPDLEPMTDDPLDDAPPEVRKRLMGTMRYEVTFPRETALRMSEVIQKAKVLADRFNDADNRDDRYDVEDEVIALHDALAALGVSPAMERCSECEGIGTVEDVASRTTCWMCQGRCRIVKAEQPKLPASIDKLLLDGAKGGDLDRLASGGVLTQRMICAYCSVIRTWPSDFPVRYYAKCHECVAGALLHKGR